MEHVHHFILSEYYAKIAHFKYSSQHKSIGCFLKNTTNKWMLRCVPIYDHEFVVLAFFPNGEGISENSVIPSFYSDLFHLCQVKQVSHECLNRSV